MFSSFTRIHLSSVGCGSGDVHAGSRILIFTHPGSRILDPKTATKERGEKKNFVRPFFVPTYFPKFKIISFEMLKKKIWANFLRIIERFSKKIVEKLLNMVLGSGIRDPEKTYSGFPIF